MGVLDSCSPQGSGGVRTYRPDGTGFTAVYNWLDEQSFRYGVRTANGKERKCGRGLVCLPSDPSDYRPDGACTIGNQSLPCTDGAGGQCHRCLAGMYCPPGTGAPLDGADRRSSYLNQCPEGHSCPSAPASLYLHQTRPRRPVPV